MFSFILWMNVNSSAEPFIFIFYVYIYFILCIYIKIESITSHPSFVKLICRASRINSIHSIWCSLTSYFFQFIMLKLVYHHELVQCYVTYMNGILSFAFFSFRPTTHFHTILIQSTIRKDPISLVVPFLTGWKSFAFTSSKGEQKIVYFILVKDYKLFI